jgi:hypothetical protein
MKYISISGDSAMQPFKGRLLVVLTVVLLAAAIDIGAFWVLGRIELGYAARIAVALTPLPADIALIVLVLRRIRKLDEFQKRVHFEAVAVAFLSTGVAVFMYGYFERAHAVGPLHAGLVWALMLLFYAVGYGIAVSHYK